MSLSKPFFFHLKSHLKPYYNSPVFLSLRHLSFASPEEAAAERRRRKRRLRIEPPLNSLRHHNPPKPHQNAPPPNPNSPKLPDSVSALSGNRLNLHNRILTLIRQNDLEEASLLVRHSIYSNCRPTVFTCNAVLAAQLRQSRYADLLSLHRFITQAGVAPNVVTHNLLLNAYCDCRRTDTALEHYRQVLNDSPFSPSPTTYRILTRGLVSFADPAKVDRALALKDEMLSRGLAPDPTVYSHLMLGLVKIDEPDRALGLFAELKEKMGGFVDDGVVYGPLMKGYFKKGMEKEAMDVYNDIVLGGGGGSRIRMGAIAYNSVLDALSKNGKLDDAVKLFDRMMGEHDPPRQLTMNLGSFNVMVDLFCSEKKFTEATEVFQKMGEKRCVPDTPSCNNLIEQLCGNGMVAEAEEIYREISELGVSMDECTSVLLVDACFAEGRVDDAAQYFRKMVESGLTPNVAAYNKVIGGLLKEGKVDEAKVFFDQMVEKLKPDSGSYATMLRGLCEGGKLDEALKMVGDVLKEDSDGAILTSELREFVAEALRKEGREEELTRLFEEREREKAEALAKEAEATNASAVAVEAVAENGDVLAGKQEQNEKTQAVEVEVATDTVAGPVEDASKDAVEEASKAREGGAAGQVAA
ncbi:pentatricopeptide repeat-containing protein At3g49240, mitochondrial [Magnolia sinica]|uniref:pentatricopeptide repeat-containing protein At3g49240, mitochondrial n=1 Tax=Magnolia sinica TaxID=86752 RepID=UPI002658140D|nr:pentatricopeptide repeat-containing protein At3g49240, mitochondrial [Magnolia sinica]